MSNFQVPEGYVMEARSKDGGTLFGSLTYPECYYVGPDSTFWNSYYRVWLKDGEIVEDPYLWRQDPGPDLIEIFLKARSEA